jgi:hypothetical protein
MDYDEAMFDLLRFVGGLAADLVRSRVALVADTVHAVPSRGPPDRAMPLDKLSTNASTPPYGCVTALPMHPFTACDARTQRFIQPPGGTA